MIISLYKFKSKICCSFRDNFDQKTVINFENGSLSINQTWVPDQNMVIEQKKGNEISKIDGIGGLLVGGASLNSKKFIDIIKKTSN